MTFAKIWKVPLSIMKLANELWEHSMPINITQVKIVNEYKIFTLFYNIIKPLISKRMTSRITFLGTNYEALTKSIQKECIPEQYGGEWTVPDDYFTDEKIDEIADKVAAYWDKYAVVDKRNAKY